MADPEEEENASVILSDMTGMVLVTDLPVIADPRSDAHVRYVADVAFVPYKHRYRLPDHLWEAVRDQCSDTRSVADVATAIVFRIEDDIHPQGVAVRIRPLRSGLPMSLSSSESAHVLTGIFRTGGMNIDFYLALAAQRG